jgi:hypothetical protein
MKNCDEDVTVEEVKVSCLGRRRPGSKFS